MFTQSRIAFVAGIAIAASAFTLTAMADAPAEAPVVTEPMEADTAVTLEAEPLPIVVESEPTPIVVESPTPAPDAIVQDYPAYTADNPETCADGYTHAEDYSCVPVTFWDESEYPTYTLPACEFEDSTNCYWDASVRGNGGGSSFVNLNGVYYYSE